MDQTLRAEPLRQVGELVGLTPGRATQPRAHDRLDTSPGGERLVEYPESRTAIQHRPQVDELHPEPDVRLVGPEPLHHLVVRVSRERDLGERPVRAGGPGHVDHHRFDETHHRVLVDEAHLEVELGELGLPVPAKVLVAVAARDLEVAVDASDHQQLLELLRALRQRVDAPWLQARGHDEVARTLRRRLDQRRRLDLDEPGGVVRLADRLDHAASKEEPFGHRLAPDVEVAVLQPKALVDRLVRLVDVEGRRLRLGQDVDLGRLELDLAGRHARVLGPG